MARISLITVVYNSEKTIEAALNSVRQQSHQDIEYIVVDGASTDGTLDVINKHRDIITKFVSEPDTGIYNALNKGIRMAEGDVVGILHADDLLAGPHVLANISRVFDRNRIDACYGDLNYVDPGVSKTIREWRSEYYYDGIFNEGWMPAHPTLFVRRWVYQEFGGFREDMKISADYEFMLRILHLHKIKAYYLPQIVTLMRVGGASNRSLRNMIRKTTEDLKAWRLNRIPGRIPGHIGRAIFLKNFSKVSQFITPLIA